MGLGSTQPLTEMSTRNIFFGCNGGRSVGLTTLQPYNLHVPIVFKPGSLNLLEPSGPVQACDILHNQKTDFKNGLTYGYAKNIEA